MSDEQVRRLERAYRASRAEADAVSWLLAATRLGSVSQRVVALAAACPGDVPGRRIARAAGVGPAVLPAPPITWRARPGRDESWLAAVLAPDTPLDDDRLRRFACDCAARALPLIAEPLRASCARALAVAREDPARAAATREALEAAMADLSIRQRKSSPLGAVAAALTVATPRQGPPDGPEAKLLAATLGRDDAPGLAAKSAQAALAALAAAAASPDAAAAAEAAWQEERLCADLLGLLEA